MTLKTDFSDGDIFYTGATSDTDKLNGITNTINGGAGVLGEVRLFALSMSGAVTKATLQGHGWAICDGTTPATQGITSPTIATTPNLEDKFIRMSDDETSGATGGSETHNHKWYDHYQNGSPSGIYVTGSNDDREGQTFSSAGTAVDVSSYNNLFNVDGYTNKIDTKPPYYELAYFMKVK